MEERLIICPDPCFFMIGSVAAIPCNTPRIFTSIMRFHSSTLSSSSLESGITPALFTITSIRPQVSRPNLTNAWTSSRVVTSKARYSALPPSFRSASASVFNRPVRLAPRTTAAPFRLSTRAVASPMPLLAPVMRTTLSLMCDISFPFFICENNPSLPKFLLLRTKFFEFRLRCLCHCWSNLHADPAVRHDDRSHDETCFVRSQECRYLRDLFRLCGATDRRVLPVLREKVASVRHEVIQQVCYDITSSDGVDTNAMRDALDGEHPGELCESALGSCIRSNLRKPEETGIRSDVHNRPRLFRGHRPHRLAGMKESAGKVDGENAVPFLQRKIQNACVLDRCGIVYEDV